MDKTPDEKEMTPFQFLHSTMKWLRLEQVANILLDAYSYMLCHHAIILAMNNSFDDPWLQFQSQMKTIELCFRKIFSVPNINNMRQEVKDSDYTKDLEILYYTIFKLFEDLLITLISEDFYKLKILKEMINWMSEDHFFLQERVLAIISKVLNFASNKSEKFKTVDAPCLGFLAGDMCFLCFHDDPLIGNQASIGLYYLLCIAKCRNVHNVNFKFLEQGSYSQTSSVDVELTYKILEQDKVKISEIIGESPLPFFMSDFVWSFLHKLFKDDYKIAMEASSMLHLALKNHAKKVTSVPMILDYIYKELSGSESHIMHDAMMEAVALLSRASHKTVIYFLMEYPVPADQTMTAMWKAVSTDPDGAFEVLGLILQVLKSKPGDLASLTTVRRRYSLDYQNMMPVMACHGLCTLLAAPSYKQAVAQYFPQLLMAIMRQLYYSTQLRLVSKDRPPYARDALRVLINCTGLQDVDSALAMKNCWTMLTETANYRYAFYLIARALSDENFPQFSQTVDYLYNIAMLDCRRRPEDKVITVIFLSELLTYVLKKSCQEKYLTLFKRWITDTSPEVCKLSLQKIIDLMPVINNVEDICGLLLAIVNALYSKWHTVVTRALITLRIIIETLDTVVTTTVCIKIAFGYIHLMEHANSGIRSLAIRHFGELLIHFLIYRDIFKYLVKEALMPLILYLEDTETKVVQACKYTLDICGEVLNWSISHWLKDENYNFELVVLNICNNFIITRRFLIKSLATKTTAFLKNGPGHLRSATLILTGYLAKMGENILPKEEFAVMLGVAERGYREDDPVTRQLTDTTCNILKKISHSIASSFFKRHFRKRYRYFTSKKLKLIYNCEGVTSTCGFTVLNIEQVTAEEDEDDFWK